MIKVITYGTYDLFHHGHEALLRRAKALGDYLVVGVTADDFDRKRGKINVRQSLMERIENVRRLGVADEIIVEEYEGQKIDDIRRLGIDIFTVGSDWTGKFDYLGEYCKVVYLPRTSGVSSSEIRSDAARVKIGFIGDPDLVAKYRTESSFVNGLEVSDALSLSEIAKSCRAVYVASLARDRYKTVKDALQLGLNVICESPVALSRDEVLDLQRLAKKSGLVLFDGIKTAYSTAYDRMLLLIKTGEIGRVVSVDSVCTSLKDLEDGSLDGKQGSLHAWGAAAMLPIFQILGTGWNEARISSCFSQESPDFDLFTKIDFDYVTSFASLKVGKGVKSEGSLVVSGTSGYVYVPAPWWKTDYFELRKENPEENRRFFYRLDGEGIRYMLVSFLAAIEGRRGSYIDDVVTERICEVFGRFESSRGRCKAPGPGIGGRLGRAEACMCDEPGRAEACMCDEPGRADQCVCNEQGRVETGVGYESGHTEPRVYDEPGRPEPGVDSEQGSAEACVCDEPGRVEPRVCDEPGVDSEQGSAETGGGTRSVGEKRCEMNVIGPDVDTSRSEPVKKTSQCGMEADENG